jgi:hypothetical protein
MRIGNSELGGTELLTAIGRIVANTAQLEYSVAELGLRVRTLQPAAQLTTLVGKNLCCLIGMKRGPRASVRSDAVDHDGMAEDHVPRLTPQFDHAKGMGFN